MIYKDKESLITARINKSDIVLDVGFLGQGIQSDSSHWPHLLLKQKAKEVYGIDLDIGEKYSSDSHYQNASAEKFDFSIPFDVIFAGDIIEHLSNPGLFLESCKRNLTQEGRLIITTPNVFNLFNLTEKCAKREPTVNKDHTCYFNNKTLSTLLVKNGFESGTYDYMYTLNTTFRESLKKKALNILYYGLSLVTDKFIETVIVETKVHKVKDI